jgi:hypothetical protein
MPEIRDNKAVLTWTLVILFALTLGLAWLVTLL